MLSQPWLGECQRNNNQNMPDVTLSQLYGQNKAAAKENAKANIFMSNEQRAEYDQLLRGDLYVPQSTLKDPGIYRDINRLGSYQAPKHGYDVSSYADYMQTPESVVVGTDIDYARAEAQPGWEQARNVGLRLIPDIVMGTVANLAAIADIPGYVDADGEMGYGLSTYLNDLQESLNMDALPIYRKNPEKSFDITDSGYLMDNISNLLNSAGSFIATGAITGGILNGISKAMQTEAWIARVASKLKLPQLAAEKGLVEGTGEYANFIAQGISKYRSGFDKMLPVINSLALNQAEGAMEVYQVYNDVLNKKLDKNMSFEQADAEAKDAATLDLNLNRANFLLNLTSAGAFTRGGSILEKLGGGARLEVLGETAQESLEEGVNYIAQREAMIKSEQGDAYSFDPVRALSHLGETQGLEAMAIGGLGGALQTAGTHAYKTLRGAKDHSDKVKSDLDSSKESLGAPTATDTSNAIHSQMKTIQSWLDAKRNAKDDKEYNDADQMFTDMFFDDVQNPNQTAIKGKIAGFTNVLNDKDSTPEQKNIAQKSLQRISDIQEVLKSISLEESQRAVDPAIIGDDNNTPKFMRKGEIIRAEIAKKDLQKSLSDADSALSAKESELSNELNSSDPAIVANANNQLKPLIDKKEAIQREIDNKNKLILDLKDKGQIEAVIEDKKAKAEKQQLKTDAMRQNKSVPSTPQPGMQSTVIPSKKGDVPPSGSIGGSYQLPSNPDLTFTISPRSYAQGSAGVKLGEFVPTISHKDPNFKLKEGEITDEEFSKLSEPNTITVVKDKDGDLFAIIPEQRSVDDSGKEIVVPPQIIKHTEAQVSPTDNKPLAATFLQQLLVDKSGTSSNIRIGDIVLDPSSPVIKGEKPIAHMGMKALKEHLMSLHSSPLPGTLGPSVVRVSAQSAPAAPGMNPNMVSGEPVSQAEIETESKTTSSPESKRPVASAINYLAVKYRMIMKSIRGVSRMVIADVSGVERDNVNDEYLVHGDDRAVYVGSRIVFRVARGTIQVADRSSGKLEYDKNGILKTKSVTAEAMKAERMSKSGTVDIDNLIDVPIEIWTIDDNGKDKHFIGYLGESRWLLDGVPGNRDHHMGSEEDIEKVNKIRETIEKKFIESGINEAYIHGEISDVSAGVPYLAGEIGSVNEKMYKLSSDIESLGLPSRFGYYDNGGIKINGISDASNIIANYDEFAAKWKGKTGMPVVLLPARDGKVYAIPAWSRRINTEDSIAIKNGIIAASKSNPSLTESYNKEAIKGGAKNIDTIDGLREFLRQFIHINTVDDINNGGTGDIVFTVMANSAADDIIISAERIYETNPISVSINALGNPNSKQKFDEAIDSLNKIIDLISNKEDGGVRAARRNFHLPYSGKKEITFTEVNGELKAKTGRTFEEIYGDTLQTNATHAGSFDGKNIYLVQQVTQFSADMEEELRGIPPVNVSDPSSPDVFGDITGDDPGDDMPFKQMESIPEIQADFGMVNIGAVTTSSYGSGMAGNSATTGVPPGATDSQIGKSQSIRCS